MLIDHTNRRVLDVLESREKTSIIAYLAAGKASGLFAELAEVTTDMWDGYGTAVAEVFGDTVRVTIDRTGAAGRPEGIGCILSDAGELVGQDCQLLCQPSAQRPHRGL